VPDVREAKPQLGGATQRVGDPRQRDGFLQQGRELRAIVARLDLERDPGQPRSVVPRIRAHCQVGHLDSSAPGDEGDRQREAAGQRRDEQLGRSRSGVRAATVTGLVDVELEVPNRRAAAPATLPRGDDLHDR
jgi:hypothetical protein